jgi:membrane protease subunit HflK
MAWNEPGGGDKGDKGDKDPWGNKNDQGPPDLDEAFKKLQNNLSQMFGGKSSGSGGSSGGGTSMKMNSGMIGGLVVLALLAWGASGVYTLDEKERGVVLRLGKVNDEILLPGLHWNPPLIDQIMIESVTDVKSIQHNSEMLTEDENIVKVNMQVQYVVSDVKEYLLRVRDPVQSLYQSTESALRHEVGSALMNEVLTSGRAELGIKVKERIQTYMNRYATGIEVTQVVIDETAPPDAVRAAFDDVIKAREDEVREKNEATAYSNQVIPEARGEAQRLVEQALGYQQRVVARSRGEAARFNKLYAEYELAPEVTRERLYLDTMESVMSNSTKVMIDVEGGNNLLYLPLDKLMSQPQSNSNSNSGYSTSTPSSSQNTNDATRRASNRRDR